MSTLLDALDLADENSAPFHSRRCKPKLLSRLLCKSRSWCDDDFFSRNLWPCRDADCSVILGPMDAAGDEPKTLAELYAEDERGCPSCGTFRKKELDVVGLARLCIQR